MQYCLWRWDIEVNHRDEKQLIRVQAPQVRSWRSVERLPPFLDAGHAMLLLAGARAFGPGATEPCFPQPKWRTRCPKHRLTTGDYLQQLRCQLCQDALQPREIHSGHCAHRTPSTTKPPEFLAPIQEAAPYYSEA